MRKDLAMNRQGRGQAMKAGGMALAMLLATMAVLPASAQQAQPADKGKVLNQAPMPVTPFGPRRKPPRGIAMPKPEVIGEYGDWKVVCEKVPVPGKDKKPKLVKTCYVTGTRTDPKRQGVFVSVILLKVKGPKGKPAGHMITLRAPIGVFLPTGIAMEVDGKPVARAPFTRCTPMFCESTNQARKETLAKLKKGRKAKFIIYAAPGVGLPVEFNLKGFSDAMKKMASLP